ncbi:hypothetical protein THAOC_04301 [Thalassiosira oceanica]|uniref:GDT1 family protein n=1 Tax=Thalassiosira oceanica TaxID=159749 RepID=K0TAB4_THAOC|nr:hypothetical protein THAOC_04301 [Thalassiosira oceanica]|eukprot:EJK74049.1 hypothetical protein THAOC_04301 [Thalassiosira oceanica]
MWLKALLLSLGSSTDNFAVGLSLGLTRRKLDLSDNLIISTLNALGACISASGGRWLGLLLASREREGTSQGSFPLTSLLAGGIFAYLALDEFASWRRSGGGDPCPAIVRPGGGVRGAVRIGLPMTLNNLAGGAAGGAAGVGAATSGLLALLSSFALMKIGHIVGSSGLGCWVGRRVDARAVSGVIFAALALSQFLSVAH